MSDDHTVSIDIGGSHVTAAIVDRVAREVVPGTLVRWPVDADGEGDAILDVWAGAAIEAAARSPRACVAAIGIAIPAPFDYGTGVSQMRHKFASLVGRPVIALLRERWAGSVLAAAPVSVGNDGDLFALGEWWAGAARGFDRVIGITLGTGLGAGFVIDGRVASTGPGVPDGGEIWHEPFRDGVAEDYASGGAVARSYARETGEEVSAAVIADRAAAGDVAALTAFRNLADDLAAILEPHARLFRAECVVIGGNVAHAWASFGPLLSGRLGSLEVRPSTRFDGAVLLGAAAATIAESSASPS